MNENTFAVGTVSVGDNGDILTFSDPVAIPANIKAGDKIEVTGIPANAIAALLDPTHARLVRAHVGAGFIGRSYIAYNMPAGWATNYDLQAQTAENIRKLNAGAVVRVGYKTRAELFADLSPADGQFGKVWGDDTFAYIGIYKKAGPSGGGSWGYAGPLPEGEAAKADADRAAAERLGAESARVGAETALSTVTSLADILANAATISTPAEFATREAVAILAVPIIQIYVRTAGRYVPGDAGGALYKRSGGVLQPGGFTDAGGAVFDLVGDEVSVESCGADIDYALALGTAIDRAAQINATVVHRRRRFYTANSGVERTNVTAVRVIWNGCRVARGAMAPDVPILKLNYTFSTPIAVIGQSAQKIWAGYPVKEVLKVANFAEGETITLVQKTYTYKAVLTSANDVKIGASLSASLDNLVAAVNGAAGIGVTYGPGTVASTRASARKMAIDKICVVSKTRCITPSKWNNATTAAGVTFTEAHSQTDVWRFEVSAADMAAMSPASGDILKAFCKDLIPHSLVEDQERIAETFQVGLVDGNYVYTLRPLRVTIGSDPVISAPRLSKVTRNNVHLEDAWFEDALDAPVTRSSNLIEITAGTELRLVRPTCYFGMSGFVRLVSCWQTRTVDLNASDLRTSIAGYYNAYGYGLSEYGCIDSHVRGIRGTRLRHPWTDGALKTSVDSNDPTTFGGTIGAVIDGLHAVECEHTGIDAHPSGSYLIYNNPVVMMAHQGAAANVHAAQLRGYRNTINDMVSIGAGAVKINIVGTGGDHRVSIKQHIRPAGYAVISPIILIDATQKAPGTQPRVTIGGNLVVDDYGNAVLSYEGADVDATDLSVDYQNNLAAVGAVIFGKSGAFTYDSLKVDLRRATAIQARIFKAGDASMVVKGRNLEVRSTLAWVLGDLTAFNATMIAPSVRANIAPASLGNGGFTNLGTASIAWAAITVDDGLAVGARVVEFAHVNNADKTLAFLGRGDTQLRGVVTTTAAGVPSIVSITAPVNHNQELVLYGDPASTSSSRIPVTCANVLTTTDLYLRPGRVLRFFARNGVWVAERTRQRADEALFYGDASVTLTAADAGAYGTHVWNTPLTATRAATVPAVDCGPLEFIRGPNASGTPGSNFLLSISPNLSVLRAPGDWAKVAWDPALAVYVLVEQNVAGARVRGNASFVLTASDQPTQILNTPLTGTRTAQLPANGRRFRFVRTAAATGVAFTIVAPDGATAITTLAAGFAVDLELDTDTGNWWVTGRPPL